MLKPLNDKKSYQARYAKIFEQTSMNSDTKVIKITLPLLQRILYQYPEIKSSGSHKTRIGLAAFDKNIVLDGNTIMPDGAAAFIDFVVNENKEVEELEKIHHIHLVTAGDMIQVYAYC